MKHDVLSRFKPRVLLVSSLLAVLAAGAAQADAVQRLDFPACVARALAQNPDMEITQAQIEQASSAVREAEAGWMPRLNLSMTGTYSNDALNVFGMKLNQRQATFGDFGFGQFDATNPNILTLTPNDLNNPGGTGNVNSRIEFLVPVYNGGLVASYVEKARAQVRAAQEGDAAARQALVKQVLMAYEGIHAARAFVKVGEQARLASQEYVRISEKMLAQGVSLKSDYLMAQVRLDDVQVQLAQARNQEAVALDQLHMLLGMSLDSPVQIGDSIVIPPVDGSPEALQSEALANNPQLNAVRHQLTGVSAGVDAARAAGLPQVNLMARQDWNDPSLEFSSSSYTVAGVLSWNAFDGGATAAAVDRAQAARIEMQAKLRQAEDGLRLQVRDAARKAKEIDDRLVARARALTQAEEAVRLMKKRYENGLATMLELLTAQAQQDKANADLISARYEQVVQRAEWMRLLGRLTPEKLGASG
ncbi:MAG: TolC family protein [Halothiobacillaceae bacterium]